VLEPAALSARWRRSRPAKASRQEAVASGGASSAALWAALGASVFLFAFGVLHYGFYVRDSLADTPIYAGYGHAMLAGSVPYRDFSVEYPPGALPVFVLPAVVTPGGGYASYVAAFEWLMALCGAALAAAVAFVLVRRRASRRRLVAALALVGLAPLALGPVVVSRFDLWPAALTAAALAALVGGRYRLALGVLGVAVAAKFYPAVLVGPALVYVWRRAGRREAFVAGSVLVAVVGALFLPFLVLAPHGLEASITGQASRPLQIESLGAGLLMAIHHLHGLEVAVQSSHGSQNLAGSTADALALVQGLLQPAAIVLVWLWFARGPASAERLLRAGAAAVVVFVALGKVLSPQFLVWLLPLVPLVRGRRGLAAGGLLAVALVLTQLWFPYRYFRLTQDLDPVASSLVLARDLVLIGLLAVLVWPPIRRRHEAADLEQTARFAPDRGAGLVVSRGSGD
jgi:Glycosyltransferase family 87